jgi:hypothetical protein
MKFPFIALICAAIVLQTGWDAKLSDVAKRLRCSKCGKKQCTLRAFPPTEPRGYTSLPK